jgi:hypothetical protein
MQLTQREPARIITAIVALVEALVVLGVAFGLNISPEQTVAMTGAVIAAGAFVSATMIRNRVFAPNTVEQIAANVAAGRDAGLLDD